jgi:hypothetical protein
MTERNALLQNELPQADPRAAALGPVPVSRSPIDPRSYGAQSYELPKYQQPGTYKGGIPTTQLDISSHLSLPSEYYGHIQWLKNQGQYTPEIENALQFMYLRRRGQASW